MLGRLIGEQIKLLFDGYTGVLPTVDADARMLEQVEGDVAQRTTFRVFLPAPAEAVREVTPESPDASLQRGREVILVVEDDNTVRCTPGLTLRALGYRVCGEENGQQALW